MKRLGLLLGILGFLVLGWFGTQSLDAQKGEGKILASKVYPDYESGIVFSHPKHAELPCTACHSEAPTSLSGADVLTPKMQVCTDCHGAGIQAEPALESCSGCHAGMPKTPVSSEEATQWQKITPRPLVLPRPQAKLRFAHQKHQDIQCQTCHQGGLGEPTMPSMDSCMTCHTQDAAAPTACATCHTAPVQGMSATRVASANASLKPMNHDLDWLKRHGRVALSNQADCVSCHQETDCVTCHQEANARPFTVHPPGFNLMHAVDARSDMANCTSCHTVDGFCAECHTRSGLSTRPATAPPRLAFHPPGWVEGANRHGLAARRDINECASCHVENDCVTCHTGINPHPPEFRFECKNLLEANGQMCLKCHTSTRGLCGF